MLGSVGDRGQFEPYLRIGIIQCNDESGEIRMQVHTYRRALHMQALTGRSRCGSVVYLKHGSGTVYSESGNGNDDRWPRRDGAGRTGAIVDRDGGALD